MQVQKELAAIERLDSLASTMIKLIRDEKEKLNAFQENEESGLSFYSEKLLMYIASYLEQNRAHGTDDFLHFVQRRVHETADGTRIPLELLRSITLLCRAYFREIERVQMAFPLIAIDWYIELFKSIFNIKERNAVLIHHFAIQELEVKNFSYYEKLISKKKFNGKYLQEFYNQLLENLDRARTV